MPSFPISSWTTLRSFLYSPPSRTIFCTCPNYFGSQTNTHYKWGQGGDLAQNCTAAPNKKSTMTTLKHLLGGAKRSLTVSLGWEPTNLAKWQPKGGATGYCLSGPLLPFFRRQMPEKGITTLSLFSFNSTNHRFKCCSGVNLRLPEAIAILGSCPNKALTYCGKR